MKHDKVGNDLEKLSQVRHPLRVLAPRRLPELSSPKWRTARARASTTSRSCSQIDFCRAKVRKNIRVENSFRHGGAQPTLARVLPERTSLHRRRPPTCPRTDPYLSRPGNSAGRLPDRGSHFRPAEVDRRAE